MNEEINKLYLKLRNWLTCFLLACILSLIFGFAIAIEPSKSSICGGIPSFAGFVITMIGSVHYWLKIHREERLTELELRKRELEE